MQERKKRRKLEKDAALEQMKSYCAYQERCHKEVRSRLLEYQVYGQDLEEIMSDLIAENFLNEERFAKSYARGKFRIKKWGRNKIRKELKFRYISEYCIKKGMKEIDENDYFDTLLEILTKKNDMLKESNTFYKRKKLTVFASNKGFEYAIINEVLDKLL